ncbi:MAG: class I SAM-dependent methyltransferase [bacterium]|nr:class I SAM-dependent methyltransferase [bacterium]
MIQDDIFKKGEGDRWFLRNAAFLQSREALWVDIPLKLIGKLKPKPKEVLEIGASNGFRLAEIQKRHKSRVTALEPSARAIADGKKLFPKVKFIKGLSKSLPFPEGRFDLVIVFFVFHWLDRSSLLKTVSEIDRVLKNEGHLILGDFLPSSPARIRYHHLKNKKVFTYVQNYSDIFLASNLYSLRRLIVANHRTRKITKRVPANRRMGIFLLKKELGANYPLREL